MTARSSSSTTRSGPLHRLGPLRSLLVLGTLLVIGVAPFADGSVHHDWRLIPGVIAPTVMMMLVFALPLDMTMAKVFMTDASAAERQRLRFAIRVEACAFVAMLAAWTPFVVRVLDV